MLEFGYKYIFDISCYYAIVSFFLSYIADDQANTWIYMLLLVSAFLNGYLQGREKNSGGKIGRLLIPLLTIVLQGDWLGRIIALIPWIYLCIQSFAEQYHTGYIRFKRMFKGMILLYAIPVLMLVCFADNRIGAAALGASIPYLIIFVAMGFMLLQLLRHQSGTADKKIFEGYQIKQTIIFFLFSFLITVGGLAEWIGTSIYSYLVKPIVATVLGMMNYTGYLVEELTSENAAKNDVKTYYQYVQSEKYEKMPEYFEEMIVVGEDAAENVIEFAPMDVTVVAIIFGVVVVLVMFFILNNNQKKKVKQVIVEDQRETIPEVEGPKVKIKKRFTSPGIMVRYYYRTFMKKTETEEIKLHKSDTTESIEKKYRSKISSQNRNGMNNSLEENEIEELKQMYRKARYSTIEISKEEVGRMKKLVRKA